MYMWQGALTVLHVGRALMDDGLLSEYERRIYLRDVLQNNKPGAHLLLWQKYQIYMYNVLHLKTAAAK